MPKPRILIVDDSPSIRIALRSFLEDAGFDVVEAASCKDADQAMNGATFDAAVVDYMLPDGTALDLLGRIKDTSVVVLTAHASIDLAVRAIKEGAENFLTKPLELPALLVVLRRALEARRARRRDAARQATEARARRNPFVGRSPAIRRLEEDARAMLDSPSPILITGPTGSGKGVLAAWMHENGPRADEPFVDLNCATLTPTFLESELFGHERGSFTGAVAAKPGLIEVANHGTLFLDEIGDMDAAVQPKLLKVLEERRFRRLGDVRDRTSDVRLIAATHQELNALVRERRFRSDLYFRINTLPLTVPALAERRDDVPDLAAALLERIGEDLGMPGLQLSSEALQVLQGHAWPGNVREMRNVLERAALFARGRLIEAEHLRLEGARGLDAAPDLEQDGEIVSLAENERRHLERVVRSVGGKVDQAAQLLGVSRSALYERLKRHGIVRGPV
jgi:DNA-binding NtrC family response regulator